VAGALEVGAQFEVVEDLAIEDGPDRAVFIRDRLIARRQIDDAEPRVRETDRPVL
jgi:hypothetical protein